MDGSGEKLRRSGARNRRGRSNVESMRMDLFRQDRLAGTLLGAAINDASGVAVAHSALVAASIAHPSPAHAASSFRRALVGWSLRHPWSADADTMRACGSTALGLRRTGVLSPTSGAAMRAAIVGAAMPFDIERRRALGFALAEVTHGDARSVDASLFVAEVAAACAILPANSDRGAILDHARSMVRAPELVVALHYALELVDKKITMALAARELGVGNAAIEAVPLAAFAFVRFGDSPRVAMDHFTAAVGIHARASRAILGAWMGTLLGGACLPWDKVARLREGPFGPNRLYALAASLDAAYPLPERPLPAAPAAKSEPPPASTPSPKGEAGSPASFGGGGSGGEGAWGRADVRR